MKKEKTPEELNKEFLAREAKAAKAYQPKAAAIPEHNATPEFPLESELANSEPPKPPADDASVAG